MLFASNGKMNQGGKHAASEPRSEHKRDRRRGAAGRAAVLRRAPSDSDCSGETASLSADSGDRAPRPAPLAPPRSGKTRSRRRGSEWEVLEGLKDGQRFEKRPDVFNGYLHKKRKWPLKGWHKRFFVVDGGILVYARSPTDVARGRLHGSVDVGLSVISAKARRRRIDIDADEFIYHLRAKTPDVFRTWLNVLKTHRLYRQHLLTFGARESVPKIHPPLDDLPPTDTSSRTSMSKNTSSKESKIYATSPINFESSLYSNKDKSSIFNWQLGKDNGSVTPLDFNIDNKQFDIKINRSLCSMGAKRLVSKVDDLKKVFSSSLTSDAEKQVIWTDLEFESLTSKAMEDSQNDLIVKLEHKYPLKEFARAENRSPFLNPKTETTACFFFKRKKTLPPENKERMKKSNKCTNLVKYKNLSIEPPLKAPSSKMLLLGKYKLTASKHATTNKTVNKEVACETIQKYSKEIQVKLINHNENKSSQSVYTVSDCDRITEHLIMSIFQQKYKVNCNSSQEVRYYIDKVVKDLYDIKLDQNTHPVKTLFRNLLEYWLKNTSVPQIKEAMRNNKSISRQSNKYLTNDKNLSSFQIEQTTKGTQSTAYNEAVEKFKAGKLANTSRKFKEKIATRYEQKMPPPKCPSHRRDTDSFEKERRIQQLERLLKNTIYICQTGPNKMKKEKDIRITKKLMHNMNKFSTIIQPNLNEKPVQHSNSSAELPQIQETFNHLLNDTELPAGVAKEFLGAYLDVLLQDSNTSYNNVSTTTSQSTDWSRHSKEVPHCDVIAEPVIKKLSKSVTTKDKESKTTVDPGTEYLKDILDKVTTIFAKVNKMEDNTLNNNNYNEVDLESKVSKIQDELKRPVHLIKDVIVNNDDDSITIDLFKYNIDNILISNEPTTRGMSINVKLKENPQSCNSKQINLKLKLSIDDKVNDNKEDLLSFVNCNDSSNDILTKSPQNIVSLNLNENAELKPYSSSDGSSKAYKMFDKRYNSVSEPIDSPIRLQRDNEDLQSCYMMSIQKRIGSRQVNNKSKIKEGEDNKKPSTSKAPDIKSEDLSILEKPPPNVIDEKFILLLLENLTILSRNVPTLHKDLQALYSKLKKRHEKQAKMTMQGLSLLGKIYSDKVDDNQNRKQKDAKGTNTCKPDVEEKCVDTIIPYVDSEVQTNDKRFNPLEKTYKKNMKMVHTETIDIEGLDQSTSQPIWAKVTKECGINTVVHYITNDNKPYTSATKPKLITLKPYKLDLKKRKKSTEVIQELMKEMSILRPENKTEKFKGFEKDFNVYQLFYQQNCDVKNSSSLTVMSKDELKTLYRCSSDPSLCSGLFSPTTPTLRGPQAGFVSGTPGGRLAGWIIESGGPLENASRELGQAQLSVQQLQRLLDALELQHQMHHDTDVSIEGASPNVKKDRRKFGLRKKKSNSKCASVELAPPHIDPSSSHTALSSLSTLTAPPSPGGGASSVPNSAASLPIACAAARPQSLPGAESLNAAPGPASLTSLTPDHQLREDFTVLAKDLVASLKGIVSTMVCERGRLRAAMEAAESTATPVSAVMAALRTNLTSALQQNSELRSRLSRIHDASDMAEICSVANDAVNRHIQQSLSYSSSCVSASEFFDAEEHEDDLKGDDGIPADEAGVIELDGDSSSEAGSLSSEEGSASSDNSDGAMLSAEQVTLRHNGPTWTRRTRLPAPRPEPGGPSLWNLLYKNIGKDLSQISMPVTINEPLNMLQRLCEELEYSELLDSAAECKNDIERMSIIAAFAVSAYAASAHRAASKPFNPLLAETYECVRDDRGFRFLAEQVSHHPPISACHAESPRWCFWQEARIKTKFWGKSMEFQPTGRVHVRLNTTGDHYTWNKVTTCVHNLFGGQRWVDQYGDMHIVCVGTDISCKLNFIKASSWSASRHEVRGAITSGGTRIRLAGRWSEALYVGEPPAARCLWRPGAMPPEHELYYGFTRFAMELNELEPGMRELLPNTDTRFRPDQRALEEGDVEAAEQFKHELEQAQRDRRRESPNHTPTWFRKSVEEGEETWVFSGEYWKTRTQGFSDDAAVRIW